MSGKKPSRKRDLVTPESTSAVISEDQERRVLETIQRPSGFVQLMCEHAGGSLFLEDWQADFADTEDPFRIWLKSRQVGWSFAVATRVVPRCYLKPPKSYTAVIISYNLQDAYEKMRYVDALDSSIPEEERMKRKVDNKLEIEYRNGNRIVCVFNPRGKGKAEVFIDEMPQMLDGHGVYQSALPCISRGGALFMGATPLAQSGQFWDVWNNTGNRFGKFRRMQLFWWGSPALCRDVFAAHRDYAERMPTEERVRRFGSDMLQDIYDSMFEEDFQTEYECKWSDDSAAFLSWELIARCSPAEPDAVYRVDAVDDLRTLHNPLYGGMDIGRRINATEIYVSELVRGRLEERYSVTLANKAFDEQESCLNRIMSLPNVRKFVIDRMGLGMQLAERAQSRWGSRVVAQDISASSKPEIANNLRMMMEKGLVLFSADRDGRAQMHSVKRVVTAHGNVIYDVDKNEKHHADKFWGRALMCFGARECFGVASSQMGFLVTDLDGERFVSPQPQLELEGVKVA